ncbi:homoserine kinase [Thalassovita taeanensis]|uniref:Ser/Thr protein kinase RdoA involved in Cpx stress response, MazF antagonist n=1 Tax=Thalassovita taeanensis TaxID=657014 RepID=A0A1H9AVW5_9RHOB|nr:homoserine kinase [Thalassovita taeanensis]SEP80675.1 Ser/Thr protein kinase RdoA involved in Cpx stress response, MazF antagonist [Thalassovita taeanensis]
MSDTTAIRAAALWGITPDQITLAARRENTVYRATTPAGRFALRLHRPGYRTEAELTSELQWMAMLNSGGMTVPRPIPSQSGTLIEMVEETPVDLLTWLPGHPAGTAGTLDGIPDRAGFCRQLGQTFAMLHDLSDAWQPPAGFSRPHWNRAGLLGATPLWGRFWDNPDLTQSQRTTLLAVRDRAEACLAALESDLDYGLIHADALSENILVEAGTLSLIDFDDGGYGFRDFDLATFLLRFLDAPDYPALRDALLEGYATRRHVDPEQLELFILLRALTYPGWIIPRLAEPGGADRCTRAIRTALPLAEAFLRTP